VPKSDGGKAVQPEDAAASGDSPKPHGDKLGSARPRPAGEGPRGEHDGSPGDAQPSGGSPKRQGDKLGGVGRAPKDSSASENGGD
jgi:hypothetical protein